jgi:hypothetical protein
MDATKTKSDKNILCEKFYRHPVSGRECTFSELCFSECAPYKNTIL